MTEISIILPTWAAWALIISGYLFVVPISVGLFAALMMIHDWRLARKAYREREVRGHPW